MLIRRNRKDHGIFFAIWPRRTPEGWAIGRLHYVWIEGWGWGSDGHWAYANWVPGKDYDMGKRRNYGPVKSVTETYRRAGELSCMDRLVEFEGRETWAEEQDRLRANPPDHYATPPYPWKCRNLRKDATTACWYPSCSCDMTCRDGPRGDD